MIIPESAHRVIWMQRTGLPREDTASAYQASIDRDFDLIRPWLPSRCEAFLDLGCGLGGMTLRIASHYGTAKAYLLDGETEPGQNAFYGFFDRIDFYNYREETEKFLRTNEIQNFEWTSVQRIWNEEQKFDLVISLLSWGHHYPVGAYLAEVESALDEDGRIILDLRHGTGGLGPLHDAGFREVASWPTPCRKSERTVLERA